MDVLIHGWDSIPEHLIPPIKQQRPDIRLVAQKQECDLLLVWDEKQHRVDVKCPDNCAWLLAYEPPVECYAHFKDGYKYYDLIQTEWQDIPEGVTGRIVHELYPQFWSVDRTYNDLATLTLADCKEKKDQVSAIISSAKNLAGHKLRSSFIQYVKDKKLDLVHYGAGFNFIPDKFDGLFPFKYSIAMENSSIRNYCTEKISDCFLSLTMPIYWGCPNITEYFPKESMLLLDPDDFKGSLEMIEEAVRTDLWSKNKEAVLHARDLILNKYSLYPYICNLIEKYYDPQSEPKRRIIPAVLSPKERRLSYKIKNYLGIYRIKKYLKKRRLHKSN